MGWLERVKEAILPLSKEKSDIEAAFKEWHYTGQMSDLEKSIEDCELCGHPGIRYQFTIRNEHTGHKLYIGSECITRFDLRAVDESGGFMDRDETRAKVRHDRDKHIKDARRKRVVKTLKKLKRLANMNGVVGLIEDYKDRGAFTPSQLALLIRQLDKKCISYRKSDFKVSIRRNQEKVELWKMQISEIKRIWDCMTVSQQKACLKIKEIKSAKDIIEDYGANS